MNTTTAGLIMSLVLMLTGCAAPYNHQEAVAHSGSASGSIDEDYAVYSAFLMNSENPVDGQKKQLVVINEEADVDRSTKAPSAETD
jgi:hypothetical protein